MKKETRDVYYTEDLSIFSLSKENRAPSKAHIQKLYSSIGAKNLNFDIPIIVNKDLIVLDGQNRLQACKLLKIGIWYYIAKYFNLDDVPMINSTQVKWNAKDYLEKYCNNNNIHYIKFKEFIENCGIKSINVAQKLINGSKRFTETGIGIKGDVAHAFACGNFIYPDDDSHAYKMVAALKDLATLTNNNNPWDRSLIVALDCMFDNPEYDHQYMKKKLKDERPGGFRDVYEFLDKVEKCYNYGKQKALIRFRRPN